MSRRAASWLAWSLCALSLSLLALGSLMVIVGWSTALPRGWLSWQAHAVVIPAIVGAPILGALVASHHPKNPYGWLWLGFGLGIAIDEVAWVYATYALTAESGSFPAARTFGTVVAGEGFVLAITLLPLLFLLFPTGRPPSRRWLVLVWFVVMTGAVLLIFSPFSPGRGGFVPVENPLGVGGMAGEVISALGTLVPILFLATVPAVLSLVFRYRHASRVERQQIKWFVYAAILFVCPIFVDFLGIDLPEIWNNAITAVSVTVLYAAMGIAILKYRLYDIDVIINRTLVYGSLSAMLAAVYFAGVTTTQALFRLLSGQDNLPQLTIVISTLVIAALFNPFRRRIQSFIDRRFYRRKYDARKTLEAFSRQLRDETNLDRLGDDLVGVVKETMQPERISLWIRSDKTSNSK